jgi:hypothetical protein
MGGVDVGGEGGKKRATNAEINMIPFIDLLMVTIAFLLITAVWVTNSRINSNTEVPSQNNEERPEKPEEVRVLFLQVKDEQFILEWKVGKTLFSTATVDKKAVTTGEGKGRLVRFPDLAKKLTEEWGTNGNYKDPNEKKLDQVNLIVDNGVLFSEMVGVIDAIYATTRKMNFPDGTQKDVSAFNMTLNTNK